MKCMGIIGLLLFSDSLGHLHFTGSVVYVILSLFWSPIYEGRLL